MRWGVEQRFFISLAYILNKIVGLEAVAYLGFHKGGQIFAGH